jgi:hypothetical protein
MTQKHKESVAETPVRSDSVAEAPQQAEGETAIKNRPCSRCSSCLKCQLVSGKETPPGEVAGQAKLLLKAAGRHFSLGAVELHRQGNAPAGNVNKGSFYNILFRYERDTGYIVRIQEPGHRSFP